MYFSLRFYKFVQDSIDYIWDISHLHLQIYEYFKILSSVYLHIIQIIRPHLETTAAYHSKLK
jgi:hypothetical protein